MASLASGPSLTSNNKTNSTQHATASHLSTPQILKLLNDARKCLNNKSLPPRDYAPERFTDFVSPRREACLADTRESSLAFFYRRQWRLATAYNVVTAVRTSLFGKISRDTNWRVNSIAAAIRTFWSSAAALGAWPPALTQFKANYDAFVAEKSPSAADTEKSTGATAKKRGRSPSAAKSGRDKRRRRVASEDFLAVAASLATQRITVDASCVAFGRLEPGAGLLEDSATHSSVDNDEVRDYAFRFLKYLLKDIIGDQKCVKRMFPVGDSSDCGGTNRGCCCGALSTPRAIMSNTWIVPREDSVDWPPQVDALTQVPTTALTIPMSGNILSADFVPRKMKDLARCAYPILNDAVGVTSAHPKISSLRSISPSVEDLQVIEVFGSENSHRPWTDCAAFLQSRTVSCEKSYRLTSEGIKVDILNKPVTTTSWAGLYQRLPLDDVRLLTAVSLAGAPWSKEASELLTALKILNRFTHVKRGNGLKLNEGLRTSVTQYASTMKVMEDLGPLDEVIPLSPTIMQEYVAGVLMKSHQPVEWIRRLTSDSTIFHLVSGDVWEVAESSETDAQDGNEVKCHYIEFSLDSIHFFARRHSKRKLRAAGTPATAGGGGVYSSMTYADDKKQRSSGFVLEQALQMTNEASGPHANAHNVQQTRYKSLITRLPKWAVIFHRILNAGPLSDLWEMTLPLLSSFNQIGGALVAPLTSKNDKGGDLLSRFLPPEQGAGNRPLLFARISRLLPTTTESPPEAGLLTLRSAKFHIGNHSLSDAPVLASHQIAYPTVLSIKAATRTVRRIDTAWDPVEEIFLWRSVMVQQKPLHLGIDRLDEENILKLLDSVKRQLNCNMSYHNLEDPAADLLSRIDWKLVAHGVNVVMAPFSRCRSPEACKAKFISLLFENLLGVLACPQRTSAISQESLTSSLDPSTYRPWEERLTLLIESSQDEFRPCRRADPCLESSVEVKLNTKKMRAFSKAFSGWQSNVDANKGFPTRCMGSVPLSSSSHPIHKEQDIEEEKPPGPPERLPESDTLPQATVRRCCAPEAADGDLTIASVKLDELLQDIRAADRHEKCVGDIDSVQHRGTMVEVVTSIVPAHEWQRWNDEQLLNRLFDQEANEEEMPPVESERLKELLHSEMHRNIYRERSWIVQVGHGRRLKPLKDIWLSATTASLQKSAGVNASDRSRGTREEWERLSRLIDSCSDVQPILTSEEKTETHNRGVVSSTLDKVVPYFQLGKAIFHYRTQGLLALSSYYALQPGISTSDAQTNLALIKAMRSLVVLGSCCTQSLRLVNHLVHLQYQTEKRRRMSGLSQYHENFATDKPLQHHLSNSVTCLPILKAIRDRRVAREQEQPSTDPKSTSVLQATALSYHRLLLPAHDSQRVNQLETKHIIDSIPLKYLTQGSLAELFIHSGSLGSTITEGAETGLPELIAGPLKALAAMVSEGGTVLLGRSPAPPKPPRYISALELRRIPFPKSLNAGALVEKMQQLVAKSEMVSNPVRHMPAHQPPGAEAAAMSSDVGGGRRRGNLINANGMNVMQQGRPSNPKMSVYAPPPSRVPSAVAAMAGNRLNPGMVDPSRASGMPSATGQWRDAATVGQMGTYKPPNLMSGLPPGAYGQMPSMYGMPYSQAAGQPSAAWSQTPGNPVSRYPNAGGGQAAWGYMAAPPPQAGRGGYGAPPPYAGVDYSQMYRTATASRYAQAGDTTYARRGQTYMRSDTGVAAYGGDNYYGVSMDMPYHTYVNPSGNNSSPSYVWPRPQ